MVSYQYFRSQVQRLATGILIGQITLQVMAHFSSDPEVLIFDPKTSMTEQQSFGQFYSLTASF